MATELPVLLLMSGGIDSTATAHFYQTQGHPIEGLIIDYGQVAFPHELRSAQQICTHYSIPLKVLSLSIDKKYHSGEITGRNAFLVTSALMFTELDNAIIAIGIHSGTPYYDCSEHFVETMNELLLGYCNGEIILQAPFVKWTKAMIVDYCHKNQVPLNLTYSCENGMVPPCGYCLSCKDRRALDVV